MEKIMKRLSNLLSVKSLVTLLLTVVFTIISVIYLMPVLLVLINSLKANAFVNTETFKMVITFYFGTQSQKAQDAMDAKGDSDGTN